MGITEYVAVISSVPEGALVVKQLASSLKLSGIAEHNVTPPVVKVTLPEGVPPDAATVALKMTGSLELTAAVLTVTVVVVGTAV